MATGKRGERQRVQMSFKGKWGESHGPPLVPNIRSSLRCHMSNSRDYSQELVSQIKRRRASKNRTDRVVDPMGLKIGGQFGGEEASSLEEGDLPLENNRPPGGQMMKSLWVCGATKQRGF